jgi:iron complex transport system permease protein
VIGTAAGAQLGVVAALLLPAQFLLLGFGPLQALAFAGALITVLFVYWVARTGGRTPIVTLLLAGFVVSSFLISGTTALAYAGGRLQEVVGWTMGGLEVSEWSQLTAAVPLTVLAIFAAFLLARPLDLLLLGEAPASHLGLRVEAVKMIAIVLAALLTAISVTLAGIVAFVGLIVPHAVRLVYGPHHRMLIPTSALAGATFLVLADLIARVAVAPTPLPLGVVTAIVGSPFFLHLLRRSRDRYAV